MRKMLSTGIVILFLGVSFVVNGQEKKEWPMFQGIWDTDRGQLALWQVDDKVWGIFGAEAEIGGHIRPDGFLDFVWDNLPDAKGSGWFRLTNNGKSLEGYYITDLDINLQGPWNGKLIGPNNFELGDRQALKWKPGDTEINTKKATAPTDKIETATEPQKEEARVEKDLTVPKFTGDPIAAWTGIWETTQGEMVLVINETSAEGKFGESGKISGSIDGGVLSGQWSGIGADGSTVSGELMFWLAPDGKTFRGTYNVADQPDLWLVWSGTKLSNLTSIAG